MKLPPLSGREAIKRLQKAGFIATRQRGSHVRLEKRTDEGVLKITVPLHNELKRGTLARIIKDANITTEEFEALA
jgi:predicted RNA binding protein YcfA (HicA-like mRNA interferase family)